MRPGAPGRRLAPAVVAALAAVALVLSACSGPAREAGAARASGQRTAARDGDRTVTRRRSAAPGTPAPTWTAPVTVVGKGRVDVSCTAMTFCGAVGVSGQVSVWDGSVWTAPVEVGPSVAPGSAAPTIACTGPTFCMVAVGAQLVAWNGVSWTPSVTVPGAQALACASPQFCTVISGIGNAYVFDGTSWSGAFNAWGGPSSVSCTSSSFCMAAIGGASEWDGSSWSRPVDVDPVGEINAVSCAGSALCMAVDSAGNVLVWRAASWSAPAPLRPGPVASTAVALTALSCTSATACAVGTLDGAVSRWDGTTWSALDVVAGGQAVTALSCVASGFCMAADTIGGVAWSTRGT